MGKWLRRFFKLVLFVVLLAVAGAVAINVYRLQFEPPQAVHASVMRVRNGMVDFYAAKSGSRVLIFDTGVDPLGRALDALLAAMSAGRGDISDVFFTHDHPDHIGGASLLARARLHAGKADAAVMTGAAPREPIGPRIVGWLMPMPGVPTVDGMDGVADIPVGAGQSVRALPMPGHTAGSYAYFWDGVLFVGDSIDLREGQLRAALPPFSTDSEANRQSILGLRAALGRNKVEVICTGHGGCTPEGQAMAMLDDLVRRIK